MFRFFIDKNELDIALKQECILREKLQVMQNSRFKQDNIINFDEILLKKQHKDIQNRICAYRRYIDDEYDDPA